MVNALHAVRDDSLFVAQRKKKNGTGVAGESECEQTNFC